MILLIWFSEKATECAQAIERALEQPVRVVSTLEQAAEELKANSFDAMVLDQSMDEGLPRKADFVFQYLGAAVPVIVNFAIAGTDRIVRAVRTALEQRKSEMQRARKIACSLLGAELEDDLTALLLSCGMALQEPTLAAQAAEHLRKIERIAEQIRRTLLTEEGRQSSAAAHAP